MLRKGLARFALVALAACLASCGDRETSLHDGGQRVVPPKPQGPPPPWTQGAPLGADEVYAVPAGAPPTRMKLDQARAAGLLVVDLSDEWAPFIFSEADPGGEPKPNDYRSTFVALANDRATPDEIFLESPEGRRAVITAAKLVPTKKGRITPEEQKALEVARRALRGQRGRNFLEVYGIPPTLSVLRGRIEADAQKSCWTSLDAEALRTFDGSVNYQTRELARKELDQALADDTWVKQQLAERGDAGIMAPDGGPLSPDALATDAKLAARIERWRRGQARLRAVRAVQARLSCEGLLSPKSRFTDGMFDLATHEALADFERKNDIFGWGFLEGETREVLLRPPLELHFETLRRMLMERLSDAAGIIEDGSVGRGKRPATYRDEDGEETPVPDLIGTHVTAVLTALRLSGPQDLPAFLEAVGAERLARLRVAVVPPPRPPYYADQMDLSVEIDRGDIWYDFPFDGKGKTIEQRRERYPNLTVFVHWNKQKIPLARWRTTIGSWRSELGGDGRVYYKYKNSDVGPRIWKNVVAAPVWVPPDSTPGHDLLTKKVFDPHVGPVTVVNTDVMGPGFQSAYGLVMAIHLEKLKGGGLFDNQIRTHGSVDYTSIARRFSHGCHRLVNNRAVRLFGFVLQRRPFTRQGQVPIVGFKKRFRVDDKDYEYELRTRGYYYELTPPVSVMVHEGRIMGQVKKPIAAYVRKPGVDYGPPPAVAETADEEPAPETPVESAPVLGP